MKGYNEFVEDRRKELREKLILNTSTSWHCRYKLEISLSKQTYSLYLDDPVNNTFFQLIYLQIYSIIVIYFGLFNCFTYQEREDICIFYTEGMENLKF